MENEKVGDERRVYNYLNEIKIAIEAPKKLIERIEENIHGKPSLGKKYDLIIRITESDRLARIEKDKRYPYSTISDNNTQPFRGLDYYRYKTHIRTIWKKSDSEYMVRTNIPNDEDAGLICFRDCCYNHHTKKSRALIHGALVELNGKGLFLVGNTRTGKTTLLVYLLEKLGAKFISDERVVISFEDGLKGFYVPMSVRVRFSTIENSRLHPFLENISRTNATQYIDEGAIERILQKRAFYVDAGLTISRKKFTEMLAVTSGTDSFISKIIFPQFSKKQRFNLERITIDETKRRLKTTISNKREIPISHGDTLQEVIFPDHWFEGISSKVIHFKNVHSLKASFGEILR